VFTLDRSFLFVLRDLSQVKEHLMGLPMCVFRVFQHTFATITSNRIVPTITLDTIVDFDIIVVFVIPLGALLTFEI
jgi:hypothetical protein